MYVVETAYVNGAHLVCKNIRLNAWYGIAQEIEHFHEVALPEYFASKYKAEFMLTPVIGKQRDSFDKTADA